MDQAALWREFKERGSERAREELILAHLGYVSLTLKRTLPHPPPGIDREDLKAEGRLAVVRAVDRYDPSRAVKFTSFLISHIRGAFMEHLRSESWAPRSAWKEAKATGEPIRQLVSLDDPYISQQPDEAGDRRGIGARTTAMALVSLEPSPPTLAIAAAHRAAVRRAVRQLPLAEREVIRLHYYAGQYLSGIAHRHGWTDKRAQAVRQNAIKALRRSALVAWEEQPPAPPPPPAPPDPELTEMEAQAWALYHGRNMTKAQVREAMGIGQNYLARLLRQIRAKQEAP